MLKRHLRITWEDEVFAALTAICLILPRSIFFFHLYTIGVIILVMSLAFRRGLAVGLVRMAILSGVLLSTMGFHGAPIRPSSLEILALTVGGLVSGLLGHQQRKSQEALQRSFRQMMDVLARALECRDPYTEGHSRRVADYAVDLAREMGLEEERVAVIEQAGLLHDLGKIGVPDAVLQKAGALTPEEERQILRHPEEGERILRDIPTLASAAVLVLHHHEHFDGSGYPAGLAHEAIPFGDRILSVADAFDALTTDRPYHKAVSPGAAIQELQSNAGRRFDPRVVQALEKLWQKGEISTGVSQLQLSR